MLIHKTFTIGPNILLNFQHPSEIDIVINMPTLQMKGLRLREFK